MSQRIAPPNPSNSPLAEDPPRVGGVLFGPALAGGLYLLLVASAGLALVAWRFPGKVPGALASAAPWLFLPFVLLFSAYRLVLVQRRKYPAFKGFFQIAVAVLFLMLLTPWGQQGGEEAALDRLGTLLDDPRPDVRALAAEVAGHRPDGDRYGARLVRALSDPDPDVREQAHLALTRVSGTDLGGPGDPAAVKAWGNRFP